MSEHTRDWWIHESEHVFVILLLMIVLFQATQIAAEDSSESEPVVIVPGTELFTVYGGQVVNFPWIIVNRMEEPLRVKSGLTLEWRTLQRNNSLPDSITALIVKPSYMEVTALGPGDHKQYRYSFTAPEKPGDYWVTITAEGGGRTVSKNVMMQVVEPQ